MKHKSLLTGILIVLWVVLGMAFHASAQYTLSLEAKDGAGNPKTQFAKGEDLYLNINLNNAAGVAGCAFTLNFPANFLEPPATDSEGLSSGVTSTFPFVYTNPSTQVTTTTHRENSSEPGKMYFAGAQIAADGGAVYDSGSVTLFTVKFKVKTDAPEGPFTLTLKQTELFNPAAGYGTDANSNGIFDEGDTKGKVPVLVGALDSGNPNFGGDLTDDFPVILGDQTQPLSSLQPGVSGDADQDGLSDSVETNTGIYNGPTDTGTNPNMADTDGDGLTDGQEVNTYHTNPVKRDTDGDGMSDGDEIAQGRDPNVRDSVAGDELAAEFGVDGLWHYDGAGWNRLTDWDPDEMLACGAGHFIAKFTKYGLDSGLWHYDGTSWSRLTDWIPESMTAFGTGQFLGKFANYGSGNGLWHYNGNGWNHLTDWTPETLLPLGIDQFVGKFTTYGTGNGLWQYSGTTWNKLTDWLPQEMVSLETGQIIGKFVDYGSGNGIWHHNGSAWRRLTDWVPAFMVKVDTGQFVGKFTDYGEGNGIWHYNGTGWVRLTDWLPDTIVSQDFGQFVAKFSNYGSGNGLWHYNGSVWNKLTDWLPDTMVVLSGGQLVVRFSTYGSGNGLWKYDGTSWSRLTDWLPENMMDVNLR
jgi:hypothetical protein